MISWLSAGSPSSSFEASASTARPSAGPDSVLRPDEERDQTGQGHALEQVVALHGREHARGVLARQDFPAETVTSADECTNAVWGQQREAHTPHPDRAVLRAPRAVGPSQAERRVGDDPWELHAELAQHRKGALHVALDRLVVPGLDLIAVDLHPEALLTRPRRQQSPIARRGIEHRRAPQRVDHLLDEPGRLGGRVELLQPAQVTTTMSAEDAPGGVQRLVGKSATEELATLAALCRLRDRNQLGHERPFARAPPRAGPMPNAPHAQRACENGAGMASYAGRRPLAEKAG